MPETLQARKQALDAEKLRLREERKALDVAIKAAEAASAEAQAELKDATAWLDLPKSARKRIYALSAETVAAFCGTLPTVSGERGDEWLALKLKKKKVDHIFMRTYTSHPDTPEGAGVRILGSRGREWCERLGQDAAP